MLAPGEQRDLTLTRALDGRDGHRRWSASSRRRCWASPSRRGPRSRSRWSRAYNRWLTETVLVEEPRIKSSLYLPMSDPEATFKMVEDFGDKKGVIGFTIIASTLRPVTDNLYAKTYAAIAGARPAARVPCRADLGREPELQRCAPASWRRMR